MKLRVLGGNAGIGGERRTVALLLDDDILIDAGTGVGDLTLEEMARIDHVFLTHSHLDHIALLPMLIDAAAYRRSAPVTVHALPETLATLRDCVFNWRLWPDYSVVPTPESPYFRYLPLAVGAAQALGALTLTPLPATHSVPGVGYRIDGGAASFVYSGDTTLDPAFWAALNAIPNLKYLMIECTFLSAHGAAARKSGHLTPALLAEGLALLEGAPELLIAHMESGREAETWAELEVHCGAYRPRLLRRGETFNL